MITANSVGDLKQQAQAQAVSARELLFKYLPYLPWAAIFLALCVAFAYVKLRYAPKIYSVTSTLMVKDPSERKMKSDKIEEMLFASPDKNLYDEMQVIKTSQMGTRVVRALGLELMYYNKGNVMMGLMSSRESPIRVKIVELKDSSKPFELNLSMVDDKKFTLDGKTEFQFGQVFTNEQGSFLALRTPISIEKFIKNEFMVNYAPVAQRANELLSSLSAIPLGESGNIMQLAFETQSPNMGVEILNQWMSEYERSGLDEKKRSAESTLAFINDQLETASRELGTVEMSLRNFRERNLLIDEASQSKELITSVSEIEKEITTANVQARLVENMMNYIGDTKNPYRQVASLLGVNEPSLAFQITEFNKLQVERATLLPTTPRSNPMMVSIETAIEKLRQDILQNLKNVRKGYQFALDNLNSRSRSANSLMSRIPAKEKELLDIARRQKVLEQLYQFLMEKKLETAIGSASTMSGVKVLEPARSSGIPIRPNRQSTFLMAFLIGLGVPAFISFLIEFLNDRVRSRLDVIRGTQTPIIGEIGHSDMTDTLVVSSKSRKFISEQFKIIRTNLQYFVPPSDKLTILVTSSVSGEGKSFIATNIGAALSLSGKKTAILEFDIRKPKIMSGLGLGKRMGVTNYLLGNMSFEDLKVKVPGFDNLEVIPCGPVPPNPSELLLDERLNAFLVELKSQYDVVVIDTAPVGLVSDAMVISKHVDAALYVIRHDYTFKKQLQLLDEIYVTKRLPRLGLILNDIKVQIAGYGGYYGYGGYGYSKYGYSYGKDYFDDDYKGVWDSLSGKIKKLLRKGR